MNQLDIIFQIGYNRVFLFICIYALGVKLAGMEGVEEKLTIINPYITSSYLFQLSLSLAVHFNLTADILTPSKLAIFIYASHHSPMVRRQNYHWNKWPVALGSALNVKLGIV